MWQKSFQNQRKWSDTISFHFHWFSSIKGHSKRKIILLSVEQKLSIWRWRASFQRLMRKSLRCRSKTRPGNTKFKKRLHPDWKQAEAVWGCCTRTWRQAGLTPPPARKALIIFLIFRGNRTRLNCETYFYTNIFTQLFFFFFEVFKKTLSYSK